MQPSPENKPPRPNNQPLAGSRDAPGRAADPIDEMMRRRRRQRNRQALLEQGAKIVRETEGQGSFLED